MNYKSYSLHNFRQLPQMRFLTEEQKFEIEVVGSVLPFKTNNYVVNKLIDWNNFEKDPFFILTFPQKKMLNEANYNKVATLLKDSAPRTDIQLEVNKIRLKLNPNQAKQERNIPNFNGVKSVSYTHLRAHETDSYLVCRLLLE